MDELPPLPPLPPVEAFLPFPGEPDKAAEARLRANLRLFRAFKELLYPKPSQLPPEKKIEEMEEKEIWKPLIEREPEIKERLLAIERTFIERGWRLPKWERPS